MITKYSSIKQFLNRKFPKIVFFKDYLLNYNSLVRANGNRYDSVGIPPGHYYSPIPSLDEVQGNEHKIFDNEHIRDINLNIPEQFDLLQKLQSYYNSIPYNFSESPHNNG